MYKRSQERVAYIDQYIRTYYPQAGAEKVARDLEEPKNYIQQRAWYLHIRHTKKRDPKETDKQKINRLTKERDEWKRKYQIEKIRNLKLKRKVEQETTGQ